ncbi:MAG TPA: hypothetical protein VE404_02045 [Verrucomicrobiae bacterium]|nr:hypothetical protein [Verrucomicrobiae bacterium]
MNRQRSRRWAPRIVAASCLLVLFGVTASPLVAALASGCGDCDGSCCRRGASPSRGCLIGPGCCGGHGAAGLPGALHDGQLPDSIDVRPDDAVTRRVAPSAPDGATSIDIPPAEHPPRSAA